MSKKRPSLAEVINEDRSHADLAVAPATPILTARKPATRPSLEAVPTPRPEPASKADATTQSYTKLSITLPEEMHEQLLDVARVRRRAKQPYQLSQIMREALGSWLIENSSES